MSKNCDLLFKCGFINNFNGNTEMTRQGWIRMFCVNEEKSEQCKRKIFKKETETLPADNMAPSGKYL